MATNKVVFGEETLIDISKDTVTSETLAEGVTAHNADGEQIVGTMVAGSGGGSVDDSVFVTCYIDLATMAVSDVSHTYEEICAMEQAMKLIHIKCDVNGLNQVYGTLTSVNYAESVAYFQVIAQFDFGTGLQLFYFSLQLHQNGGVYLKPFIINTTALGG